MGSLISWLPVLRQGLREGGSSTHLFLLQGDCEDGAPGLPGQPGSPGERVSVGIRVLGGGEHTSLSFPSFTLSLCPNLSLRTPSRAHKDLLETLAPK